MTPAPIQRWLAALGGGLMIGFAPPNTMGTAMVLVALTAGAWSIEGRPVRDAARGALFGIVWYAVSLQWLFAIYGDFASPEERPLIAGLVVAEALLPTFVFALAGFAASKSGGGDKVWAPAAYGLAWAIGTGLCGWLQPVPSAPDLYLAGSGPLLVALAWGGRPLLVGLFATVAGALPQRPQHALVALASWLLLGFCWQHFPAADVPTTTVAVLQPNTGAKAGRSSKTATQRREKFLALIAAAGDVDWIATPETSWPGNPGSALVTALSGAPPVVVGANAWNDEVITNSLLVIDGQIGDRYDKHHLVPGAEQSLFGLIGVDYYTPGTGPRTLVVAGTRAGALICYEDMLPHAVRRTAAESPDFLLTASNDAWLLPQGSITHLSASRIAAVETRRWVVRPTASGRSAVITELGMMEWVAPWIDGDADPDHPGFSYVIDVELHRPFVYGAAVAPLVTVGAIPGFLLVLLLGALAHNQRLPDFRPTQFLGGDRPDGPVIACCGDSITHGHLGADWVGALRASTPGASWINAGINGDLAWNLAERLDAVIACKPDMVTVLIGSNDAMGSQTAQIAAEYRLSKGIPREPHLDWYAEQLDAVVARLVAETDAPIAMLTLPPIGEQLDAPVNDVVRAHNAVIREVAARHGATVLPLHERLIAEIPEGHDVPPYVRNRRRLLRMGRAILLHDLAGRSWNDIGGEYGLKVTCDFVHLNDTGGAIASQLVGEWVESRRSG